jgi:protocatechuate 3,4-dioxygenase beta subunit
MDRSDIRENREGAPLTIEIRVADPGCAPVSEGAVEVWQCDALGTYSWYAAAGEEGDGPAELERGTFLRGCQELTPEGSSRFRTIYPGWYKGRTVHVHYKIHDADGSTLTGQLYFPDELTDVVHGQDPYAARPHRDTRNTDDVIFRDGGETTLMQPEASGEGYLARCLLIVDRDASATNQARRSNT